MTAKKMIQAVRAAIDSSRYDVVSLGYPGPVVHGRPLHDPVNLGPGWVGFDFQKAFGRPTQIINDAAMQALGSYRGGRMLFLGLGTGLGSALIVDGELEPMELGTPASTSTGRRSRPTSATPPSSGEDRRNGPKVCSMWWQN